MRVPILDTKRQYAAIGKEVEEKVVEVMRSGAYILGQNNKALEEDFAKYCFNSRIFEWRGRIEC